MIYSKQNASFEARVDGFPSGLTGTVGVRILDDAGGTSLARLTAGIAENPAGSGSYIATLTAPGGDGAYTVFWDTGVVSPSTTASDTLVVNASGAPGPAPAGYTPDVIEVAALIRARTVDNNSNQVGTFTANTRPTADEVEILIARAADRMNMRLGATPAAPLVGPARELVALRAAMMVELSFYADQIAAGRSQYPQLKDLYDEGLVDLLSARKDIGADADAGTDDDLSDAGLPASAWPGDLSIAVGGSELPLPDLGRVSW